MPFILQTPQEIVIDTVRITGFSVTVDPLAVQILYARGINGPNGFEQKDSGSVSFSSDEVLAVDPAGSVYSSMKGALYALLQTRLGAGTIE
jgi:hypothetical protein